MNRIIQGIIASNGISIAKAFRLENPVLHTDKKEIASTDSEISRLQQAIEQSRTELAKIEQLTKDKFGDKEAAIFRAHLLVLKDPELYAAIAQTITEQQANAEFAVQQAADMYVSLFQAMDDPYMRERAADVKDVTKRIIANLLGIRLQSPELIAEEVIIIAEDLTPSDTVQLNPAYIKGFVTDIGGPTSHSAILARTLEIPAVVGSKTATTDIQNGELLIIDGETGSVIVNPDYDTLTAYRLKQDILSEQKKQWKLLADEPAVTKDGFQTELAGNIGAPEDVSQVLENGGEAIGLFRTEFLYMGKEQLPTEDEQYSAYKQVLEEMDGRPAIVRTLDIGGDKELSYLALPKEANPFLGLRAIRLCLEKEDIFRTQLRALLRASKHGKLRIMFPMIAAIEEFRRAKGIFTEEKEKLQQQGTEISSPIELGIMLETPAAAILADQFAKEVDFFSIGSNDLIQYTMAADRMNEHVSYLYQPYNPAILRLIRMVIDAAHKEGKKVGMCGEMARDETAVPLLIAMGLDEFSMSASSLLRVRAVIRELSKKELENHLDTVLALSSAEEVLEYMKHVRSE